MASSRIWSVFENYFNCNENSNLPMGGDVKMWRKQTSIEENLRLHGFQKRCDFFCRWNAWISNQTTALWPFVWEGKGSCYFFGLPIEKQLINPLENGGIGLKDKGICNVSEVTKVTSSVSVLFLP